MEIKRCLIDKLQREHHLEREEWIALLRCRDEDAWEYLFECARRVREQHYGKEVYLRGLVEISSYCKNNCFYCGIRAGNRQAQRYRLTEEEIIACCDQGERLGFHTFVLQGGEDLWYSDEVIERLIREIKKRHPDCAVTLSLGEKSRESYQRYFNAGADRYLLRHETADEEHYKLLHPKELSLRTRMECLWNLKEIGYQVGSGFMVGSPYQSEECLAEDFLFLERLQPHMVGIGPFIPAAGTPFEEHSAGTLEMTLKCIGLLRLLLPTALLPATTALGTIHPRGREKGLMAGANVVMPNLSPVSVRKKYSLYDNKICTGEESAQCLGCLKNRIESTGYHICMGRGDHISLQKKI